MKTFKQINKDQNLTLELSVIRDNGVVSKGLLCKSKEYQFQTYINVVNRHHFKVCDLKSYYYNKNGEEVSLKCSTGKNNYFVSARNLNGNNIKVKVELTYKLSAFTKKKLIVSCNATI